jgi:hypothetical protein
VEHNIARRSRLVLIHRRQSRSCINIGYVYRHVRRRAGERTRNFHFSFSLSLSDDCNTYGICQPAVITLSSNQGWYWCGWSAIQKTRYIYKASDAITVQIMKEKSIKSCSPKNMKNCAFILGSRTDTKDDATLEDTGIAFSGPTCLLFANNNNKSVTVSLQVFQWYDERSYYVSVLTIGVTFMLVVAFFIKFFVQHIVPILTGRKSNKSTLLNGKKNN